MARSYVASIAGGTATATVQMQAKGTIKTILISAIAAAAGSWEISLNAASEIATAQPSSLVIARVRLSATAAQVMVAVPVSVPVVAFQNVYIHCTGAGNVGEVSLIT